MEYAEAGFAARRVGTTLCAKYRLDALIGVGGMAAVYRGRHRNGHKVAVKVLHPPLSLSTDICARFLKEGYVANAVDHPGAVRVLDDDVSEDGAAFLVMELLTGETVEARRLRMGRRLPPDDVVQIAAELLAVLDAAHAAGVVHRDLKPENLFMTSSGALKVLDFGIARMRDGTGQSVTVTGHLLGTPAYMAPEQAMGVARDVDERTDLWAVGATMFNLLSGEFVHPAESAQQMLVYAASRPARALASVRADVPSALAAVVDRALAFDRNDRFPTARAMSEALGRPILAERPATTGPVEGDPSTSATARLTRTAPLEPRRGEAGERGSSPDDRAPAEAATPPRLESTTGGVSKGHPSPPPRAARSTSGRSVLAGVAALVGLVAIASALLVVTRLTGSKSADAASPSVAPPREFLGELPSASAPMPPAVGITDPSEASSAPARASTPEMASSAPAKEGGGASGRVPGRSDAPRAPSAIATTSSSASRPTVPPKPSATATSGGSLPAPPSCDPPWYIDPLTHGRKVKPGC